MREVGGGSGASSGPARGPKNRRGGVRAGAVRLLADISALPNPGYGAVESAMQSPPKIISHNELQACAARRDVADAAPASGRAQASQTRRPLRPEARVSPKSESIAPLGSPVGFGRARWAPA